MSKPIQMDNTTRVLNQIGGDTTHFGAFFGVPFAGGFRVCYNVPSFIRGIFRMMVPSAGSNLSGKDITVAALGQISRGAIEIIPIIGIFVSAILNYRNDKKLIAQAKGFVDNKQIQFAVETLAQANNTDSAFSALDEQLKDAKRYDECAELYFTLDLPENRNLKMGSLNLWPIVHLVKHYTKQATPASLHKAKKLANFIMRWGGNTRYMLNGGSFEKANRYIQKYEQFAQKYGQHARQANLPIPGQDAQVPEV